MIDYQYEKNILTEMRVMWCLETDNFSLKFHTSGEQLMNGSHPLATNEQLNQAY